MIASIVILLIVVALIVLDIRFIIGKKKKGQCIGCSSGTCNCGNATYPSKKA
ncbi:FeoB-associated Cys-rich membrane protein [Butyrivibrio sp. WCD3002]|uniref:FeoB-associated Cys-rich membrane protein n=1 Tax=Butyrivibrio sp. WCD3002 TaxID=1280676 RepID=UPI000426817E|nr:FeoB-associated Cys-rich membrane protein [Butyrivibrio sp. WCD3002]